MKSKTIYQSNETKIMPPDFNAALFLVKYIIYFLVYVTYPSLSNS